MYRVTTATQVILVQEAMQAYQLAVDTMGRGEQVSILNEHTGNTDQGGIIAAKLGYMRRFASPAG